MTTAQVERIAELRHENYSYRFIGDVLQISPNTVKSVCRRKGFAASGCRKSKYEKQNAPLCKNCHKLLTGRKEQKFCSDSCRREWWSKNRKVLKNTT